MTNEEIKKGLKICADGFPCNGCPYDDNFGKCVVKLNEDARSLIIEQEQEIARLKAENRQLKAECALLDDELRVARQETIDVLNELKEKFKEYDAWYYNGTEEEYHDLEEEIDEVIKEQLKK